MNYERPRNEFPLLLNYWGLLGTGVEVGVCEALHARNILEYWPGFLHLVDPWAKVEGYEENYDQEATYAKAIENLKDHTRWTIHRKTSLEAVEAFKDQSLDWVYLDANHAYTAVKADIEAWWPKIRVGGMLAGDDYGIFEEMWCDFGKGKWRNGVKRAVDEWALKNRKNISLDLLADWHNSIPNQGELRARGWYCIK